MCLVSLFPIFSKKPPTRRCIIVDLVAKLAARKDYLSVFELAHMMFFNSSEGDHIQYLFVEQPRLLKVEHMKDFRPLSYILLLISVFLFARRF